MKLRWGAVHLTTTSIVMLAAGAVVAAQASSEQAWKEFRKSVEAACLKAAVPYLHGARATVDPFGSASFGLSLLRGKPKGSKEPVVMICVYDKRTKKVEVGSLMSAP